MRMRKKPWCRPELEACDFVVIKPEQQKGRWRKLYPVEQPLHLELGCGKGGFISQMAVQTPGVNFLAVDMIDEMLGLAKRKTEAAFQEANRPTDNIRLTIRNVEHIAGIFDLNPETGGTEIGIAQRIYINFCNPWPRGKHYKRRLTHPRQLEQYRKILAADGEIWFKTDDAPLFRDSVRYFEHCGFQIRFQTEDLHQSGFTESIPTEHEQMFTEQGLTTKFLIAVKKE